MSTETFSKVLAVQLLKQSRLEHVFSELAKSTDLEDFLDL